MPFQDPLNSQHTKSPGQMAGQLYSNNFPSYPSNRDQQQLGLLAQASSMYASPQYNQHLSALGYPSNNRYMQPEQVYHSSSPSYSDSASSRPATISPHQMHLGPETIQEEDFPLFDVSQPEDSIAMTTSYGSSQGLSAPAFDFNQFSTSMSLPTTTTTAHSRNIPQLTQYPFTPRGGIRHAYRTSDLDSIPALSTETSRSEAGEAGIEDEDEENFIFSCTYQGCLRRFKTQADLQVHKRDGHRQANGDRESRKQSQAGPHFCRRIDVTGKRCNSSFSRPYDLTRHEDTRHGQKGKIQCPVCHDQSLFSRRDALTRHMKSNHPDVQPTPKPKRKTVR